MDDANRIWQLAEMDGLTLMSSALKRIVCERAAILDSVHHGRSRSVERDAVSRLPFIRFAAEVRDTSSSTFSVTVFYISAHPIDGPEALCFRVVRPSVCACVHVRASVRDWAEHFSTGLSATSSSVLYQTAFLGGCQFFPERPDEYRYV